jgi:Trypsin-co-occurring domain 2
VIKESVVTIHEDAEPAGVGLAEAIGQVRRELEQAIKDGEHSAVAFRPGPVEMAFEVAFTRTGGVHGGFQLSVLSLGAKRDSSSTATHTVNVSMTPVGRRGQDMLIGDVGTRDIGPK